jgi:hypothetical protein
MPPRYAYWTIVVGQGPTAFRAREPGELLPTLRQLQRRHPDAALRWFAGGRLWMSPADARRATAGARPARKRRPHRKHGRDRRRRS